MRSICIQATATAPQEGSWPWSSHSQTRSTSLANRSSDTPTASNTFGTSFCLWCVATVVCIRCSSGSTGLYVYRPTAVLEYLLAFSNLFYHFRVGPLNLENAIKHAVLVRHRCVWCSTGSSTRDTFLTCGGRPEVLYYCTGVNLCFEATVFVTADRACEYGAAPWSLWCYTTRRSRNIRVALFELCRIFYKSHTQDQHIDRPCGARYVGPDKASSPAIVSGLSTIYR